MGSHFAGHENTHTNTPERRRNACVKHDVEHACIFGFASVPLHLHKTLARRDVCELQRGGPTENARPRRISVNDAYYTRFGCLIERREFALKPLLLHLVASPFVESVSR